MALVDPWILPGNDIKRTLAYAGVRVHVHIECLHAIGIHLSTELRTKNSDIFIRLSFYHRLGRGLCILQITDNSLNGPSAWSGERQTDLCTC